MPKTSKRDFVWREFLAQYEEEQKIDARKKQEMKGRLMYILNVKSPFYGELSEEILTLEYLQQRINLHQQNDCTITIHIKNLS